MNRATRARWEERRDRPWSGREGGTDKTPVLSLINAETGEIRSQVVPRVDGANLRKVIVEQVDMAGSVLWTDKAATYRKIGQEFQSHAFVDHLAGEYVGSLGQSTNKLENFFSQLKRSIDGTHHHVSKEHLHRYLDEFDFRLTTCKMSDSGRMARIMDQAEGRRLTYRRVTAA